jgi:hypothetical protein
LNYFGQSSTNLRNTLANILLLWSILESPTILDRVPSLVTLRRSPFHEEGEKRAFLVTEEDELMIRTTGSSMTSSSYAYRGNFMNGGVGENGPGRRGASSSNEPLSASQEEGWSGGSPLKTELFIPKSPCPSELPLGDLSLEGEDASQSQADSFALPPDQGVSGQRRRGSFLSEDVVFRMEHWSLSDLPPPSDI